VKESRQTDFNELLPREANGEVNCLSKHARPQLTVGGNAHSLFRWTRNCKYKKILNTSL